MYIWLFCRSVLSLFYTILFPEWLFSIRSAFLWFLCVVLIVLLVFSPDVLVRNGEIKMLNKTNHSKLHIRKSINLSFTLNFVALAMNHFLVDSPWRSGVGLDIPLQLVIIPFVWVSISNWNYSIDITRHNEKLSNACKFEKTKLSNWDVVIWKQIKTNPKM